MRRIILKISVAIDGPAGAGKSTIAKLVGKEHDLMYINTGAMYRAVALKSIEKNLLPENVKEICELTESLEMHFENDDLIVNGENVQDKITMPEISSKVSSYAGIKEVRKILVKLQRKMSDKYNVIMDGRDIGTVVLKDADFKFFLTASAQERANRRFKELQGRNIECSYDEILKDIIERDYKDTHRETDPLKKADDAIEIDSTSLDINGVVAEINKIIYSKK
ncbi:(d)CMP kinase [uncultured Clostridium sp.]|uniref:(d)CMP kinase n=1 Tax=uncultured Clostridium sp. TaxID=59620 RepID=UPI0025D262D2|nr:(d)CMP kinase [uncultured Clostridium sp.]